MDISWSFLALRAMFLGMISSIYVSQFTDGLLACNLKEQYQLLHESGKFLRCLPCRKCGVGFQPWPKCGTTINVSTIIEPCQQCPVNTYSSEKGTNACQTCNMMTCFKKNQIYKGICTIKVDTTYCIDVCKKGYKMNSNKTACVLEEEKQSNITEQPVKDNEESAGLSSSEVFGIVFSISLFAVAIIVGLCWHYKRKGQPDLEYPDSSTHIATDILYQKNGNSMPGANIIVEEQSKDDGSNENKPCQETPGGFGQENTRPSTDIRELPVTCSSSPESGHVSHTNGSMQEELSTHVEVQAEPQPPPCFNKQHQMRLGDLQQDIITTICRKFNTGPIGKDYEALAGWLGFTSDECKQFKLEKNPTAALLDNWGSRSENTVTKFLKILEENGMTNLADIIHEGM